MGDMYLKSALMGKGGEGYNLTLESTTRDFVMAISYAWWTKEHPDSDGVQLRILDKIMQATIGIVDRPKGNLAVFVDYMSLYQKPKPKSRRAAARLPGRGDCK